MIILILPLCIGVLIGFLRGGRLDGLGNLRFRAPGLVLVAFAIQASLQRAPARWRLPLVILTYAVVGGWIALNLGGRPWALRVGLTLVAVGWAMNLAAILPNGGMPVSESALRQLGVTPTYDVGDGHLYKHLAGHAGAVDVMFGDSIPVRALGAVISVGDIVLAGGIAFVISAAMVVVLPEPEHA